MLAGEGHRIMARSVRKTVARSCGVIEDGLVRYVVEEYVHCVCVVSHPTAFGLYREVQAISRLRDETIKISHERFIELVDPDAFSLDRRESYLSSIAALAVQAEVIRFYAARKSDYSFDYLIAAPFRTRFGLLGLPRERIDEIIHTAFALGKTVSCEEVFALNDAEYGSWGEGE